MILPGSSFCGPQPDEYGFSHDGTGAARTGEPSDCRQQMKERLSPADEERERPDRARLDRGKIAIRATCAHEFGIRHAQDEFRATWNQKKVRPFYI